VSSEQLQIADRAGGRVRDRLRHLAPFAGVALFAVALFALHHTLRDVRYRDIVRVLHELPRSRVLLSLVTTALGYGALTLYDTLACRYVGRPLPYRQTAFASFVGYAFSHTLGIPVVSGGAIRLRLYTAWGLSATEVGAIILFNALTFWLGFTLVGGIVLLVDPPYVPETLPLPVHSLRAVGAGLVLVALAYVAMTIVRRTPIAVRGRELRLPEPRLVGRQLVVAAADWLCASLTLWALLPSTPHLSVAAVLGAYLLAQTAGLVSHVPGGLGVFETVIVLLLAPPLDTQTVVGSLVAFRAVYYFLPLVLAAVALGVHELGLRGVVLRRVAHVVEDWGSAVAPQVLAAAVFASGTILLVSGVMPVVPSRLDRVAGVLPLVVIEIAHVLASLVGLGLVVLARDVQRRVAAAYPATVGLLAAGIVLSLVKGFAWEESLVLAVTLAAFLPCRSQLYREATALGERLTPRWTAAVVAAVGATVWLFLFVHRHTAAAPELWWQVALRATGPRAVRTTAAVVVAGLVAGAWMLRRPARRDPARPDAAALARVESIVAASPSAMAALALAGDKCLLFADDARAFVTFGIRGRSWIALGDPVGDDGDAAELTWRFRELTDHHETLCAFHAVEAERLPIYLDLGLTLTRLGEAGRVALADFSLGGDRRARLRERVERLAADGWTARILDPTELPARMDALQAVADAFRATRHGREPGFSVGRFSSEWVRRFPTALVERDGAVAAFATVLRSGGTTEIALDLVRHAPGVPPHVGELLLVEAMRWGRSNGYAWFDVGLAPAGGTPEPSPSPGWSRLQPFLYRHAAHFADVRALRAFADDLGAVWTPRYLAAPGGLALTRVLADLTALIAGDRDDR
jgi:phosphatidylglycerol lysyltransferase